MTPALLGARAPLCLGVSPAGVKLEDVRYDGETLFGRLTVGAVSGPVLLDKRLIENVSVNVRSAWECTTGLPSTIVHADHFPKPPRGEDLLLLKPGSWYGARVRLWATCPRHALPSSRTR